MSNDARDTAKAIEDLRRELRKELRDIKDALNEVKELRADIQSVIKENQELKAENDRLHRRIEEVETYQRSNNLEIKGVPSDVEPLDAVKKICGAIQEEITSDDVDICHRVPTARHDQTNIVVRFVRRTKKLAILSKSKKVRIDSKDLGSQTSSAVYVNEHLTKHGKQLLGSAIQRKKEMRWKFVWTSGGKIFARRNETSPILKIRNADDLAKMTVEGGGTATE